MPDSAVHVLYVDDDAALVRLVERACARRGYALSHAAGVKDGLAVLASSPVNLVVLDHDLQGETGLDFLAAVSSSQTKTPFIYVTGSTEAAVAVSALKAGASDYVVKTADGNFLELLFSAIDQALELARLERARLRAEQEVREARDRAELMLREVNHRVANSLAMVASLVRLQASLVSDPGAVAALTETQVRISAISGVHRRLYRSTDMQNVALDEYLRDLVADLKASLQGGKAETAIDFTAARVSVATDRAVSIGVALTELLTNAVKYAYPAGTPGAIRVVLDTVGSRRASISVEDDGHGWDQQAPPRGTGLGTRIISAMMANIGTKLEHHAVQSGTRTSFEFAV
jgi:two-component sensor histidine kinase/CheY-like chemotaxis protein